MAFMAPAPDQGYCNGSGGGLGLARSLSIPASYNSGVAMSPTDSMGSLSSLEKLMEGQGGGGGGAPAPGAFASRSATTSPTGSGYWGHDMVAMLAGAGTGTGGGEVMGSGMVSSDWQTLLDGKSASSHSHSHSHSQSQSQSQQQQAPYKYLPAVSMAPATTSTMRGGIMENARIREMLAGRGKGGAGGGAQGKAWGGMEVAGAGITVDPSKGGLALQGVGLATSHCLAQFTSDPAFAERAAKFSSFGNGKYPQIALPLPVNDGGCKPRSRSAESSGRLSRTSSSGQNNSGAAKKLAAAVAAEVEEKQAASAAVAQAAAAAVVVGAAAAERSSTNVDMDVDGVNTSDDKSPPGSAPAQPELEAIEGASLAAMDRSTHEVEVPAAREPTNSCSGEQVQQQRGGGPPGSSPATSPARSPSGSDDSDRRKRKNSSVVAEKPHVDPKAADVVDSKPKRLKGEKAEDDVAKAKAERSCSDNSGEDSGSPRAHKESAGSHKNHKDLSKQDYIHVRARRGQATDSHSLAERVRREKISERMKYLQDLVPGCSKVTGKAVMLDEIINYVQSLQRQVENLSMKLASVNPGPAAGRLDYSFESALNKELLQGRLAGGSSLGGPESSSTFGMLQHQQQQQQHQQNSMLGHGGHCGLDFRSMGGSSSGLDGYLRRSNSAPINVAASGLTSVDTFSDDVSQSIGWDGELQSIVNQMGFGGHQGRFGSSILDGLHSQLPVGHMKVEM
ncbi:hypothetical protein KC19_1G325700 [Ceratodon purpureus]|uniref:BHLH domain-containing protein n=1 Tax=Ceratodon purpureus TaxID=3225 RepID=A0A8T0JD45_CERPU|nr:hypothetical protein KC19_1G325700 [Ceratodon purpureus]